MAEDEFGCDWHLKSKIPAINSRQEFQKYADTIIVNLKSLTDWLSKDPELDRHGYLGVLRSLVPRLRDFQAWVWKASGAALGHPHVHGINICKRD